MDPVRSDDEPVGGSGGGPGLLRRTVARASRSRRDESPAPLHPDPATGPIRVTPPSYGTTMPAGAPPGARPTAQARHGSTDASDDPVTDQPYDRPGRDRSEGRR